jgi:outer membrane protein, heavy metal efflux system
MKSEKAKVKSEKTVSSLEEYSPLKMGGFLITITMLFVLLLGAFTTSVLAQSSTPKHNTPLNLPLLGETLYPELKQYLQTAIEQNPELQSLRAMTEADRERVRETGLLMDPEITVMYDFNPMMYDSYLGRFSVSAMQMFPWFGSLEARRELQRSAADVRQSQISVRQLEILRDVKITWLEIAEVREQILITEQTVELVTDLEKLVEVRYETGRAGQADILRIQMEEQRLRNRIANLEDQLYPMKARFNELLNRDMAAEVETPEILTQQVLVYDEEEIRTLVRQTHPQFDGIAAERTGAEQQRRLAELDGRPSFGLGVEVMGRDFGAMSMFPDAQESFIGMATVRIPLFRSRYDSQRRQAGHRIRALDQQEEQTANRLMTELESAMEEIRTAERSVILLDEELVPRAEQALQILSEEYATGNARFDELLQIQRELLELKFERIEAITKQNRAAANIESLIGENPLLRGDR